MKTLTTETFIAETMPWLIGGRQHLRVLVSTYNDIPGYVSGMVPMTDEGLEIQVAAGGASPFGFGFTMSFGSAISRGDVIASEMHARAMERWASKSQEAVTRQVAHHSVSCDVAVIYAGLSAFDDAVDTALEMRNRWPDAHIVVLTCDCDLRQKLARLQDAAFGSIIVTPECGGRGDLRKILEAFVGLWPNRSLPPEQPHA